MHLLSLIAGKVFGWPAISVVTASFSLDTVKENFYVCVIFIRFTEAWNSCKTDVEMAWTVRHFPNYFINIYCVVKRMNFLSPY